MINSRTSMKVFPIPLDKNDYDKLQYDIEGLWSITHPEEAELISKTILNYVDNYASIIDTNAGCGGNLISFIKYFDNITGIELDQKRFNYLINNLKYYTNKKINCINDDCLNLIYKNKYDVYFFDPPWGGPEYKKKENIELYLSEKSLFDILNELKNYKLIVIKVPYNYNIKLIYDKFNILKKIESGNVIFLFFN